MIKSRLRSKARTTIPQAVRAALRLREGDEIAYAIVENRVVMTRVRRPATQDPFGTFEEWNGEADQEAYAEL